MNTTSPTSPTSSAMTPSLDAPAGPLSADDLQQWHRDGYVIVRGLMSPERVARVRETFDDLAAGPTRIEGHFEPATDEEAAGNPLKRYPRVMHPHAFLPEIKAELLDPQIGDVLRVLLDDEPIATQTMFYFKPSGSKGQALHQDNYYLRVAPHTCIAAWCAIDPSRPDNGGMEVVPGTQDMEIACADLGDDTPEFVLRDSFETDYVAPPEGKAAVPCVMEPGDVLFFNGSVIHGSTPNNHPTLWRRSLIHHYMPAAATSINGWYHTHGLWSFDGTRVDRDETPEGGPCGREKNL